MFNTGSKFPVNQNCVVNKIENAKLGFEITPCKLGIALIFIHKHAKILETLPAEQHLGLECIIIFRRASIKNNVLSDPIAGIQ